MHRIGIVTTSRADYGIWLPVLRAITASPRLTVELYVTGMHLAPAYGLTVEQIRADGFPIAAEISSLLAEDSPAAVATAMGLGTMGFAQAFQRDRPDLLMVLGDRFDMLPAALAALPFNLPVAHVHGGETTTGAIDDALRHAITQLSQWHFTATEAARERVIAMGAAPAQVICSGAPALDHLAQMHYFSQAELEASLSIALSPAPVLVTFHPETRAYAHAAAHAAVVVNALRDLNRPVLITRTNADTAGGLIQHAFNELAATCRHVHIVDNLGTQRYFSLLRLAAAIVGNSSSGLIEAPSFALPVVNIGGRQGGRLRAANVIDVPCTTDAVRAGLARALTPDFRATLCGLKNPYGDGQAAARIVHTLETITSAAAVTPPQDR